ncbi:hypothetical protein CKO12_13720, partial [Chromatium okenii]|uniref:helix-turn-helix domain-containing protein n=1 Tax=Chromatium okenii TaxID=61644 RepID=UPI001A91393C
FEWIQEIIPAELQSELRAIIPNELRTQRRKERDKARPPRPHDRMNDKDYLDHYTLDGVRVSNREKRDRALQMRAEGMTFAAIAKEVGVTATTVRQWSIRAAQNDLRTDSKNSNDATVSHGSKSAPSLMPTPVGSEGETLKPAGESDVFQEGCAARCVACGLCSVGFKRLQVNLVENLLKSTELSSCGTGIVRVEVCPCYGITLSKFVVTRRETRQQTGDDPVSGLLDTT